MASIVCNPRAARGRDAYQRLIPEKVFAFVGKHGPLIHVIWEENQGVVDIIQGKWLVYVWGKLDGHHSELPTVGITDADFKKYMGVLEPNWDHVAGLLIQGKFPLKTRAEIPEKEE